MDLRSWLHNAFEIGRHSLQPKGLNITRDGALVREDLCFLNAADEAVPGIVLRPGHAEAPCPAILYIHAHGGRYTIGSSELTDGRPALQAPLGPVLASMGYVVLSIDLPCFGARATASESAVAKARLWYGQSLAGQMLGELSAAVDWLTSTTSIPLAWRLRAVDGSDIRHLARCRRPAPRVHRPRMLLCRLRGARGDRSP